MQRRFEFTPGEYYHVYNRGVDKRVIFRTHADYERFMMVLYLGNGSSPFLVRDIPVDKEKVYAKNRGGRLVDIGAFVLMPNHFHLLIKERSYNGISRFMKKILTAHSMYFNLKHQRTGVLFQGRFRANHVDDDTYLRHLFTYLHLNPIGKIESSEKNMSRLLDRAVSYPYSSLTDYVGPHRASGAILNSKEFPNYHSTKDAILDDLQDWNQIRSQFEKDTEPLPF